MPPLYLRTLLSNNKWRNLNKGQASLVHDTSVLGKSRKLVSCVIVDYENKTQMLLINPINSIFYRCTGVIIDREESYALRSAEVYICIEHTLFSYANYLRKHADILIKALYLAAFCIGG